MIKVIILSFLFNIAIQWGCTGHFVIVHMALREIHKALELKMKTMADLPDGEPKTSFDKFLYYACWPDSIRDSRTGKWHYADVPFFDDNYTGPYTPNEENATWLIEVAQDVLKNKSKAFPKSQMIRYIIHVVGDFHQPMHCITRVTENLPNGDSGGNAFILPDGI